MGKEKEVQVVVSAKDLASGTLNKIGGILAGAFSVAAITAFGKAAVESASEQEQAEVKLAQALGHVSQGLLGQASALQKTTKYADEQIINAQASLAMFTKNEAQLKQLTKATLDFAAAKGMDLTSAADIVGKSLGSETSMLGRYGIATEGAANSTERFASIMQGLESHFGGQAVAQANTFSGSIAKMKNQFGETLEVIGNVIVKNPVVIKGIGLMSEAFSNLAEWLKKNQIWAMEFVQTGLVWLVRGFGYVAKGIAGLEYAFLGVKAAANFIIHDIVVGIKNLLSPLNWVMDKLVSMGALKANPLAGLNEALANFSASSKEVLEKSLQDIDASVVKWDKLTGSIFGFANTLAGVKVVATDISAAISKPAEDATAAADVIVAQDQRMTDSSWLATVRRIQMNDMMTRADQIAGNIRTAAYKSMETQLMRLVEVHKFSAAEFGKAVMQSVKAELVGIAARATVWALFETAMGLATMFTNPAASASHFAAAGEFALVAGATVAAAAAVNAIAGPGAQTASSSAPGSSPSNPTYTSGVPEPSSPSTQAAPVYNIQVTVNSPMVDENWDAVMEKQIAPATIRAVERGVAFA